MARQWIRHRTANVNEISARYSVLDREFYLPAPDQLAAQSSTNRQGRGAVLTAEQAAGVLDLLRGEADRAYDLYEELLNADEQGAPRDPARPQLARELARMTLTLGSYTQWYWKTNLHNLFNFLQLRADSHAQAEIRAYADVMIDLARAWVPQATAAFDDYRMGSATLSRSMLAVVRRRLAGEQVTPEDSGLSKREWAELADILGG